MFGMGMALDPKDFALVLKRPLDMAIGACAQFLIMPGLAYLLARAFDLDPALTPASSWWAPAPAAPPPM
jgi:BASS family bile acid:Na+ symporter